MSTLKTVNVIHPSGTVNNITTNASGQVGIANTAPAHNLDVGDGTAASQVFIYGNVSGSKNSYLAMQDTSGSAIGYRAVVGGTVTMNLEGGSGTSYFNGGGNVLIGTASQVGIGGQLQISGANAVGGAGYNTFLTIQNTTSGATNTKKYFRLSSTGGLEVINDAYTAAILVLDNSGILSFNSGYGSAAPAYGCRAWLNYNLSTQTTRASANVSSVTFNSTGYFTINFTSAMPDANYAIAGMGEWTSGTTSQTYPFVRNTTPPTTANCPIVVSSNGFQNPTWLMIQIVR